MDKKNLHLIFVGLCIGIQYIGKLVRATMRSLWRFLKKVKIELPSDLAIPLLGASRENHSWLRQRTPSFTLALFTIAKTGKHQTVHGQMQKWYTYRREYYSVIKINEIMPIATT